MSLKRRPLLLVITGPTAVGKTSAALKVAQSLDTEIISADSRQLYEELNIGVARPSEDELSAVPHHLIAEFSIHQPLTTAAYTEQALKRVNKVFEKKNIAILTGGTGLYIKSVIEGLDNIPATEAQVESELLHRLEKEGLTVLQGELKAKDPVYAQRVDLNNPRRVIRALAVILQTGSTYTSFLNQPKQERIFDSKTIVLTLPRPILYKRINERVDAMMKNGLEEEVNRLRPFLNLRALDTVGYKEFAPYLLGECSKKQVVDKIKQHSRNYAKRQMTWFKNQMKVREFTPDEFILNWSSIIKK